MTAVLLWVLRLLIIYFLIQFTLSALGLNGKNKKKLGGEAKKIQRFDEKNKDVSDGDFKEL